MTEPQAAQDPRRAVVAWLGSEHIVAEIQRALPDHIPVDWFMRLAQTAILMNPDLATADKSSLLRELVAVAQLGLVLDPQMGEAWLIVDNKKQVQRRSGYQGLRKLALQSGLVTGLNSQAVYANDQTDIEMGDSPRVRHKIDVQKQDRGELLGCYAVGRDTGTHQPVVEWMSWKQIEDHRDRYSQAKSGPWSEPLAQIEMGRKTVFRRLCKWLPKSPLLADALAHEDRLDMRVINPDAGAPPEPQARPSAVSMIVKRNAPPKIGVSTAEQETRTALPETAPGRAATPQDVGYSSPFEAVIDGERYVKPEDAALALTLLIEQSTAPGAVLDFYADVMNALPGKIANEVLAAAAARGNKDERKHAAAEAAAQEGQARRGRPPGSKNRPKNEPPPYVAASSDLGEPMEGQKVYGEERPSEPAGEARSQEPAATPAPGRDDDPPDWTTEEQSAAPEAPRDYKLINTQGDIVSGGLRADAFLSELHHRLDNSRSDGERRAWVTRNRTELQNLAQAEGGDLGNDALDLLG